MDMRKYASTHVKPDHVRDGPIQTQIVNVFESEQYGRPVLELETGSQFTLNEGNNDTLIKAWGHDSVDWIGQEIELVLGHYQDRKTNPPTEKETVKVRAVSPAKTAQNGGAPVNKPLPAPKPVTRLGDDPDDGVPF